MRCGSLGFAKTVGNSDDVQTSSLVTSTLSCHVSLTSHTLYSSHSLYVYGFTESDFHATSIRDAPAEVFSYLRWFIITRYKLYLYLAAPLS